MPYFKVMITEILEQPFPSKSKPDEFTFDRVYGLNETDARERLRNTMRRDLNYNPDHFTLVFYPQPDKEDDNSFFGR